MTLPTQVLDRRAGATDYAALLTASGAFVLRYSVVLFLLLFGMLKWTPGEANAIQPMVANSPLLSWLYPLFGIQGGSEAIGVIELATGLAMATRRWMPRVSAVGSLSAAVTFVITLSFLITTPHVGESVPFLLKDLTLLGASLWAAGEALSASTR